MLEKAYLERSLGEQVANSEAAAGDQEYAQKRRSPHLLWTAPVTIHFLGARHVGLVRDVSREGIGIYSRFIPPLRTRLQLEIRVPRCSATILCVGTVVRTETEKSGNVNMIGISLEKFTIQGVAADAHWSSITEALRKLRRTEANTRGSAAQR